MSTREQVQHVIHGFITSQFPAARDESLSYDDSLLTGGIVDSMGILELVTFVEDEFGLTLTDDEMLADHFETIALLTELVLEKTSGQVTSTPEA